MADIQPAKAWMIAAEPKREKGIFLSMFSDRETLIVEACLFIAVPVSIGLAVLSAVLFN